MTKKIWERLNGDLTDPLNLNILIYICTYMLSILSSFLPYSKMISSGKFDEVFSQALQAFTDCIVTTTATLILGSAIQNLVTISQNQIKRFALTVWSFVAVIVYTLFYSMFRGEKLDWLNTIIWLISIMIVILNMFAISQVEIEKERGKQSKSLSG